MTTDSDYEKSLIDIFRKLKEATLKLQLQKVETIKNELQTVLTKYMTNKDPKWNKVKALTQNQARAGGNSNLFIQVIIQNTKAKHGAQK